MKLHPAVDVAVVMERIAQPNAWEDWQFRLAEVVPDEGAFGIEPRKLHDDGKTSRWLFPGFKVELFADECKGYFLNLTSGQPVWFVSWVIDSTDPSLPMLTSVGVSYIEADRRMTAEECVENVALEPELCEWLRVFTNEHFRPDTMRKVRAMSFLSPEDRERLTPQPDYSAVTAPELDARVRNAALTKLFLSDPHFRASDGLNVGVDEVFELARSPQARQHKIMQARALGLLDDELTEQDAPPPDA